MTVYGFVFLSKLLVVVFAFRVVFLKNASRKEVNDSWESHDFPRIEWKIKKGKAEFAIIFSSNYFKTN